MGACGRAGREQPKEVAQVYFAYHAFVSCSLSLRGPSRGLAEEGASPHTGIGSLIPKPLCGCAQDLLAARVPEQGLDPAEDTAVRAL